MLVVYTCTHHDPGLIAVIEIAMNNKISVFLALDFGIFNGIEAVDHQFVRIALWSFASIELVAGIDNLGFERKVGDGASTTGPGMAYVETAIGLKASPHIPFCKNNKK